jgi:hypothetical protein
MAVFLTSHTAMIAFNQYCDALIKNAVHMR